MANSQINQTMQADEYHIPWRPDKLSSGYIVTGLKLIAILNRLNVFL